MPPRLRPPLLLKGTPFPRSSFRSLLPTTPRRSIRSILKPPPKPSRFDASSEAGIPAALSRAKVLKRKEYTIPSRTGVLGVKRGHVSVIDPATARRLPATVLQLDRCQVISHKTRAQNGYFAVQVGAGYRKPQNLGRGLLGHLAKHEAPPKEEIGEFRVRDSTGLPPEGAELRADWFSVGQFVDCQSRTKGKGFAGVMKRHGMAGQPASHGVSKTHRTMGSAGGSQGSGSRVIPGKKMAGRMGGIMHTVQNLQVLITDPEKGILVVKGLVSGPRGVWVRVQDSKKMPWQARDLGLRMACDLRAERPRIEEPRGTEALPGLTELVAALPEVGGDAGARA